MIQKAGKIFGKVQKRTKGTWHEILLADMIFDGASYFRPLSRHPFILGSV